MLEVNVLGVARSIEAVLPGMFARGSGHIVGISSVAGYRGMPWMPGYSASKAALTTYLEALRPRPEAARGDDHDRLSGLRPDGDDRRHALSQASADDGTGRGGAARRPRGAPSAPRLHVPAVHGPRHGCAPMAPERPLRSDDGPRRAAGADHRVLTGKVDLTMSGPAGMIARETSAVTMLARCLTCRRGLLGRDSCATCGRSYPEVDRILEAIGPLTGTNRIAAAFYDGPNWRRFRPWERLFLWFQGPGPDRARRQVLRHLPEQPGARVLEVGIGDGENLPTAAVRLGDLRRGHRPDATGGLPRPLPRDGRAAGPGGGRGPCPSKTRPSTPSSASADSTTIRDHAAALREMRRVARRGAPVIVADELPDLYRFAPGSRDRPRGARPLGPAGHGARPRVRRDGHGSSRGHRRPGPGRVAWASPLPDLEPPGILSGG